MVNLRLQSILASMAKYYCLASMAKYYWILHYLSLLLSRLKHSFICKGVIGQNADIHLRKTHEKAVTRKPATAPLSTIVSKNLAIL